MDAPIDDVLDGLESFLVREVDSLHAENDWLADPRQVFDSRGHHAPRTLELIAQVRIRSAAAGYYAMVLPSDVGGSDLGFEGMFLAWERVFRHCGSLRWLGHHALAHWTKGPSPLLRYATPATREKILGPLTAGERTMCLAMSEPEAGSDSWSLTTRARRTAGGWSLTGTKQWISNGVGADHAVVLAITDEATFADRKGGVGAFLVDTTSPGFAVAGVSPMFGSLGSDEATLHLDDVFVPDDHVLGEPGGGFAIAMEGVGFGKVYNCAKAIGLGAWALHSSLEHVKIRRTFGRPLADHQAIAFGLSDSATSLHAARLVALDAARRLDAGVRARKELAMAKVLAADAALAAIDRAVQSHGAMGFTNELGLAKAWQTVRILGIADGTSEILRRQIAQDLLKGDTAL
jgi:alkylation response protein AidB-like acyl-CoA dehydrogenase